MGRPSSIAAVAAATRPFLLPLLALVSFLLAPTHAFHRPPTHHHHHGCRSRPLAAASAATSDSSAPKQATLDSRTPWLLSLTLTREGFEPVRGDLRIRFVENRGYEPPQGRIFVERDSLALVATDEKGFAVGPSASWTLSEDKDDRKWGLWVQGLFEEPKYPYIYFALHTEEDARVLLDTEETDPETGKRRKALQPLFGGKGVPGGRLDFRFDHRREAGTVVLSEGKMSFQEMEMRQVDPLGIGGKVNVGDVVEAGTAALTPVLATS